MKEKIKEMYLLREKFIACALDDEKRIFCRTISSLVQQKSSPRNGDTVHYVNIICGG